MAKHDEVYTNDDGLPAILDHEGNERPLGFIPAPPERVQAISPYSATTELIPESEWVEFDFWPSEIAIKDQDGKGACNGHAAATGAEMIRYVAGMPYIPLSAWYVYSILCNGIDRGSQILDALELLESKGVAPESDVQYGIINPRKLTAAAHTDAARFKVEIGSRMTTAAEIVSAVLRREPINLAVCVGAGFNNLSSEGIVPLGRGFCNHAIAVGFGLKKSKSGVWLVKMINSWTTSWGQGGFGWLEVERVVRASAFEAYHLRAIADDTADNTGPPILIA